MNIIKKSALALAIVASGNASAALYFNDWGFNPDGTGIGGAVTPIDELTYLATTLVSSTGAAVGDTFEDYGRLAATGFQNDGGPIAPIITGLGVNYELTATFRDWTGTYVSQTGDDTDYEFDPGGTLNVWIDGSLDYSTVAPTFANAENGLNILSLAIREGSGNIDFDNPGGIDGNINIEFEVTGAVAGYWFLDTNDDGTADTDIVDLLGGAAITIALTDSNANITTPSPATIADFIAEVGPDANPLNFGDGDIYVLNDGSLTLAVVPAPGALALLGAGLIGLGWARRKA